ncbi:hypothetical protein ACFX2H_015485 [Malus domestica]
MEQLRREEEIKSQSSAKRLNLWPRNWLRDLRKVSKAESHSWSRYEKEVLWISECGVIAPNSKQGGSGKNSASNVTTQDLMNRRIIRIWQRLMALKYDSSSEFNIRILNDNRSHMFRIPT